jgi:hypothetical protein
MICPLHFVGPGAKYPSCGSASALPPPSLGVSSLDLGRWRASGLFFALGACCPSLPWDRGRLARPVLLPPQGRTAREERAERPRSQGREGAPKALRDTHSGFRHLAIELCAMRWHLLRRGNTLVAVARCGRFLPRLGPLAMLVALFLCEPIPQPTYRDAVPARQSR